MKLNKSEKLILELLQTSPSPDGGAFGLQLIRWSAGQLKRGTIYVTLGLMEERGLVSSLATPAVWDDLHEGPRRYSITDRGKQVLAFYVPPRSWLSELAGVFKALFTKRVAV